MIAICKIPKKSKWTKWENSTETKKGGQNGRRGCWIRGMEGVLAPGVAESPGVALSRVPVLFYTGTWNWTVVRVRFTIHAITGNYRIIRWRRSGRQKQAPFRQRNITIAPHARIQTGVPVSYRTYPPKIEQFWQQKGWPKLKKNINILGWKIPKHSRTRSRKQVAVGKADECLKGRDQKRRMC